MKRQNCRLRRGRRGTAMIEVLVAALIVATSMAAILSMRYFSFHMLDLSADKSVAYNLARQAIEQVKETGFDNTAEAPAATPVVHYFDGSQVNQDSTPSKARYKVTLTVVSDLLSGNAPASNALRTVTVLVTATATGQTICRMDTYLVRAGI